jgi:hypothetical protein
VILTGLAFTVRRLMLDADSWNAGQVSQVGQAGEDT